MASYSVENGKKILILDDASKVDVFAPLGLDNGFPSALIEPQRQLLVDIKESVDALSQALGASAVNLLDQAEDLVQSFTYLDAGTLNQRISTATYSSNALDVSRVDTYVYAGTIGNYRLQTITRVIVQ